MAETLSTMVPLGSAMPAFEISDFNGETFSSKQLAGKPALVIFMCNHCPFVKYVIDTVARKTVEYRDAGVTVIGINSNDVESHPDDSPARMKDFAAERSLGFPYLFDETQEVARSFGAACTPDFFLYGSDHRLVYRGQFDDSRPSRDVPVTGEDLTRAVQALVKGEGVLPGQKASIGCNIKWKPGNESAARHF